ncbi:MT-A70 family methyltransferase [Mesorhizobium sp. WSM2239]|uniref:MT-A70 family methyltransferase n=2 Tax=unclassified Mesorhizobium TaxID=325217 RepID=A0AAU8D3T1_9HYPH
MIRKTSAAVAVVDRDSLPALIRQAADALAGAQTAAEVLDARDKATLAYDAAKRASRMQRAKRAHDDIIAATHRAQADALEIEAAAKRRLADEYDGAQSRGEVASKGKPVNVPAGNNKPTVEDIGLTRKDVFEARQVRDAIVRDPGIVRAALDELISSGDEPTRTALKRAIAPVAKSIRAEEQAEKKERRGAREIELAAKQAALPAKKYGVIYADPEWKFEPYSIETGMDRAPDNHYPTSDLLTLMQRDVGAIAAKDCVLFLWATAPMLVEAICLLDAWGFAWIDRDPTTGFLSPNKARCRYVSHWAWLKQKIAPGYWNRGKHEILLIATRGNPVAPAMGDQLASWQEDMAVEADATGHSKKPDVFAEWIEKHWPNTPKIELNARRGRPGWDVWGNEASTESERGEPREDKPQSSGECPEAPPVGVAPAVAVDSAAESQGTAVASSSVTADELAEYKALGAIAAGVTVQGPLVDSLKERGLIWAGRELTVGGAQRLAELGRMVEAASDGDAVHVAPKKRGFVEALGDWGELNRLNARGDDLSPDEIARREALAPVVAVDLAPLPDADEAPAKKRGRPHKAVPA